MTDKDLIRRLRTAPSRSKRELLDEAADAIETLGNFYAAARAELERLRAQMHPIGDNEGVTDADIIGGLRCTSTAGVKCIGSACPFYAEETVYGVGYMGSCDIDRIGLLAAERLERLANG